MKKKRTCCEESCDKKSIGVFHGRDWCYDHFEKYAYKTARKNFEEMVYCPSVKKKT